MDRIVGCVRNGALDLVDRLSETLETLNTRGDIRR